MTLRKKGAEDGFTLVELLLVMVILPLIAGAIAVAIITTEKNAGTTKTRLTDSANAQISSEYYVPDVQGAQFATTKANIASPYSSTSPQVCGSGTTLLLGLYRPTTSTSGYMSVGYWLTSVNGTSEIVRNSCTLDANFNATVRPGGTVVLSDDINAAAQGSPTITPGQFATAAAAGWAPVTTATTVTATTTIPASGTFTLPVNWTSGFDLSQALTLTTAGGFQSISCTGPKVSGTIAGPGSSFTGCSINSGVATTTVAGSAVTQPASMAAVNLAVFEPGSAFSYRLNAVPRAFLSVGSSGVGGAGIGAPALLTLGGADQVTGGSQAILNVHGNVNINGGSLSCTGGPYVYAYGYGAISGTSAFQPATCATGGPTTTQPPIPDPYANVVANLTFPALAVNPAGCAPGEYTAPLNCTTLTPGIYKLDQGLGNVSITCPTCTLAGPNPQGVLLYLPPGTEAFSTSGNRSINIPAGLSTNQSAQFFGTTALQGLVVWQDKADTQGATLGGTSSLGVTLTGTLYFPSASVTIQGGGTGVNISTGRIIANSIIMSGSATATINPQ